MTLVLDLDTGEPLRISTADPDQAARLIRVESDEREAQGALMTDDPHGQAWFGPKRIGYGLRTQTWQGWLIVLGSAARFAAAMVALAR